MKCYSPHIQYLSWKAAAHVPALSCVRLFCNPMDCNAPGSTVHRSFWARILGWLVISYSGDLPDPGIEPTSLASPALADRFFTIGATWETLVLISNICFSLSDFTLYNRL